MEKHDLLHEFPQHKDKIHSLKVSDVHFRKLFDEYHQLDRHIQKINAGYEVVIDEYAHELKAKMLFMKDEIYSYLTK